MNIILGILILVIYGNSFNNEYSLDDDLVVFNKAIVEEGVKSVKDIFTTYTTKGEANTIYRPIPLLSFALEKTFFKKLEPFQTKTDKAKNDKITQANISHFVNVILYFITCVILFHLLKIIFKDYNVLLPLLVVVVFTVHPLHTEPVNNLKSRDELLMFLFVLSSVYQLIMFFTKGGYQRLLYATIFFLLARFSKENAIIILGIIPVILYFIGFDFKKILLSLGLYVVAIGFYMFIKRNLVELPGTREYEFFENPLYFGGSILEKLSLGFYCSWVYLKLLIYPKFLSFYYGYNQIPMANFSFWQVWFSLLFYIPVGVYGVYLFFKRNIIGLGLVLWFGLMLGVINVFFPIVGIVADRFAYALSLGYCIVVVGLLFIVFKISFTESKIKFPLTFVVLFMGISSIYAARVIDRNKDWHDHLSLYNNDIKHLKESAKAHSIIANTIYPTIFEKIQKNPKDLSVRNDIDKTIYHYKEAIRIDSTYLKCINNLASIYAIFKKDYYNAIQLSERAIKIKPQYLEAHFNLGYSYDALGNFEQAFFHYLEVIKINPEYKNVYTKLEILLANNQKLDEGIEKLNSLAINHSNPKNIYLNIANFISKQGLENIDEALIYFEKTFDSDTSDVVVLNHIIKLYEMKQDSKKVEYYKKLKRI